MKFELFPAGNNLFYFRLKDAKGQIIMTSEKCYKQQEALDVIGDIRYTVHESEIVFVKS